MWTDPLRIHVTDVSFSCVKIVGVTEKVQHYNFNGHNWLKITVLVHLWCIFLSNLLEERVFTPLQILLTLRPLCSNEIPPSNTFLMLVAPFYTCTCFDDPLVGDISAQQRKHAAAAAMSHFPKQPARLHQCGCEINLVHELRPCLTF